ncbi:unnamed protein product [Soboliphyme baturini]|uniref:Transthyretin-like family protein n=1 Tax=Soboliphyme baturini TaxID=241478 RepID=A0A183J245_9BILA|nr:unnamed protein product [Soboliphyme baturini]
MAEVRTGPDGSFSMSGHAYDVFHIDPRLKIYHRCNHVGLCERRWQFKIPKNYVKSGRTSNKVLDIGTWNLMVVPDSEESNCI